jgi:hypothetical protein
VVILMDEVVDEETLQDADAQAFYHELLAGAEA